MLLGWWVLGFSFLFSCLPFDLNCMLCVYFVVPSGKCLLAIPLPYLELSQSMKSNMDKELSPMYILTHSKKMYMKACLITWSTFQCFQKLSFFSFFLFKLSKINTKGQLSKPSFSSSRDKNHSNLKGPLSW